MEDKFWQANFWGIIGTVSGTLGLIISWLNWRYSKPKIIIAKLELQIPPIKNIDNYVSKQKQKEYYIKFILNIRLRNKKGGSGSIEKPLLIMKYKLNNKFYFFPKYKEYILKPKTKHTEWVQVNESISNGKVIRHGEAWNFNGGETIDDELIYLFTDSEFYDFAKNWEKLEYYIEYYNNFGKRFYKRIQFDKS